MYWVADIVGFIDPCAATDSFLMSAGLTQLTTRALAPKSIVVPSALAALAEALV